MKVAKSPSRMNILSRATRLLDESSDEMFAELDYSLVGIYGFLGVIFVDDFSPRKITSGSCKCPLAAAFHPPARGRSSRCPGHLWRRGASSVCGTRLRSADSGNPDRYRRDFGRPSQSSPPGPPAWSTCSRSRCTTGNWSANHIA